MRITKQAMIEDLEYLDESIGFYQSDFYELTTTVATELKRGRMSIKEFILWSINDIFNFVFLNYQSAEEDKEFLLTDERALQICKRYKLEYYYDSYHSSEN